MKHPYPCDCDVCRYWKKGYWAGYFTAAMLIFGMLFGLKVIEVLL
ncbi:hypothetical protein ES702_04932 [subsurface metagenome]